MALPAARSCLFKRPDRVAGGVCVEPGISSSCRFFDLDAPVAPEDAFGCAPEVGRRLRTILLFLGVVSRGMGKGIDARNFDTWPFSHDGPWPVGSMLRCGSGRLPTATVFCENVARGAVRVFG